MRLVIFLISFGCILQPSVSEQYFFGENRYCANYHNSLRPSKRLSGGQCQHACDNDPKCVGYIMSCGVDCYLMASCSETVVSSCNSYVAAKMLKGTSGSEFRKDPWRSPRFFYAIMFLCGACIISACIFKHFLRLEDYAPKEYTACCAADSAGLENTQSKQTILPAISSHDSGRSNNRSKDGDLYTVTDIVWGCWFFEWKYLFRALLVIVFCASLCLPLGMVHFPSDGSYARGVCGLVHKDRSKYTWSDLFTINHDRNLLVNGSIYPDPAFDALPHQCQQVYSTDVVDYSTGPKCQEWCAGIASSWYFHVLCSFPTYGIGHIYIVCNKVFVWETLRWIPSWAGPLIAFFYCCASRLYAEYTHNMAKSHDPEYAAIMNAKRPETENCTLSRTTLKPPLCMITARSDASILEIQTWIAVAGFVIDPAGDLNGSISFLLGGEFMYAACLIAVSFIPNLHDPLQSEGTSACLVSLERGFPTRRVYVLQMREGAFEGIYSLVLAVYILMRSAYFHSFGSAWHLASISFVAATSVINSLPHAGAASLLLQSHLDFDNYTEVEETNYHQHWMKFFPVFDGIAFAVAFGRTFSNSRLALWLWSIGVVIGVLPSYAHALFSGRCCISRQVILAFIVWPLSPVRLAVDQAYWRDMVQGRAELAYIGSRGCASLPPIAFYTHRWLTLIIFWIFTAIRPDNDVYTDTFAVFLHWSIPERSYKVFLAFIFIMGWLCLPVSMLWFWLWRSGLEVAYDRTKLGQVASADDTKVLKEF